MHYGDKKTNQEIRIASFFAGCGGLDLGFKKAGFNIVWANEFDKSIWETFEKNFPGTQLDKRSIVDVKSIEIPPRIHGIIGGPPCQAWSEAGEGRGLEDVRGRVFLEYIRIIKDIQPLFFLAENVSGILFQRHSKAFNSLIQGFRDIGYEVSMQLLNAKNYNVPQDRERVIIVGYHKDMEMKFEFPKGSNDIKVLKDAIGDLSKATPAKPFNKTNEPGLKVPNHEYMTGGFSSIYMSRNRVRSWDEPSFTIQAGGRHAPIHPQAPKMKFISQNKRIFVPGKEHLYRRLSVRECARIQTFPDNFVLHYKDLADGYKMVGNAVPVNLAKALGEKIMADISEYIENSKGVGMVKSPINQHFYGVEKTLNMKYKTASKKMKKEKVNKRFKKRGKNGKTSR